MTWPIYSTSSEAPVAIHSYEMVGADFPINVTVDPTDPLVSRSKARGFQVIGAGSITVRDFTGRDEVLPDVLDRESFALQFSHIVAVDGPIRVRVVW